MKTKDIEFHWDKSEQSYINSKNELDQDIVHNLEDYFDFLKDIEPASNLPEKRLIVDKQFTLY
jgi:hypothetical protein